MNYAILIDGGFAKRKIGNARHPATAEDFGNLIERIGASPALRDCRLHRVYYYDSSPLTSCENKPLTGGAQVNFGAEPVVARAQSLFGDLAKIPFVALRLGELTFNGWELRARLMNAAETSLNITAADLRPRIQQKGVDMRIGMDIAALTLKKHAQIIVLVSGDSDFIPAMKFARREGCQLFLCTLGQRVKPAMYEHSDLLLGV